MAVLEWHTNTSGRYISGVSHGVFYGDDGVPIPWNGLISVSEKFQTNEPTPVYNSLGQKYDLHGNVAEKRHSIVCYTYPEEMDEYLGTEYVDEFGFAVDERPPRKFNMVYRSDCDGYYELHVLLDQIATFGDKTHATDSSTPGISNITMNLQGVPHEVFGSSHLIFDSRNPITASAERILFGTRNQDGCFNNFLNADVEWIPQAINYAPTIEPDYENRVWVDLPLDLIHHNDEYDEPVWAKGVEEVFDDLPPDGGRVWMADESIGSRSSHSHSGLPVVPGLPYRLSFWAKASVAGSRIYLELRDQNGRHAVASGGVTGGTYLAGNLELTTEWTKYESVVTLTEGVEKVRYDTTYWNHSNGSANAKQYLSDLKLEPAYDLYVNPNPGVFHPNNVPGVKDASKWNTTNVVPYWDEVTEQLALHSVSPEEWAQSKLSIPLDVSTPIDLKTSADINFGGMVDEVVGENLLRGYRFSTRDPITYSTNTPITNSTYYTVGLVGDLPDDGELVTISFRMDVPAGRTGLRIFNSGNYDKIIDVEVNSDGYYTLTFPWVVGSATNEYINIYSAASNGESETFPGDATIYWIKLEYGDVATKYSPHPSNALHRRIIGTREPQVLSDQAPNIIGSQTVTLDSTVSDNPHVDIYHNGPAGSDDVRVNNLMVVLQNYRGGFFDGNTVPKTRGERYRRVESEAGYYTVYEHLQFRTQSEIELRTIGTDLYELTGPETHLSTDGDQFTFSGPQATSIGDDTFEIDDTILGF